MQLDNKFKDNPLYSEYVSRINRVTDYIENNLGQDLNLEKLAGIANFSRFHFHRIFGAMMGEPLNRFIQRLRIERAASSLVGNPGKSITEIAIEFGFSSSATFARVFKEVYGMSASEWRDGGYSKICKTESKWRKQVSNEWKDFEVASPYFGSVSFNNIWSMKMKDEAGKKLEAKVEVKELPEMNLAYVRHKGPYAGNEKLFKSLFARLFQWAGPRELIKFPETKVISVYHDDPEITSEENLRTSCCITIPEGTETSGEIGSMKIEGGKYAVGRFELVANEYPDAWDTVFGVWLPQSGYQCDDKPCFEIYQNNPEEHPEGKHIVDICIPVKPL